MSKPAPPQTRRRAADREADLSKDGPDLPFAPACCRRRPFSGRAAAPLGSGGHTVKNRRARRRRMPLRYPRPLSSEEWKNMVENLKKGPTPKQREIMKEAEKWSKHTKVPDAVRRD